MLTYTQLSNQSLITAFKAERALQRDNYEMADVCSRAVYSMRIALAMMDGRVSELPEVQ